MDIITLNGTSVRENTVAAIGFFDGVHVAHKELIKRTVSIGQEKGLKTAIITFNVHPKSVLFDLEYYYLTPLQQKLKIFETYNIDTVYVIEFTKEKASMEPHAFIEYYLKDIDTLVCGFDFHFGVRGSGSVATLQEYDRFETVIVPEFTHEGYKVGSSYIRDLIRSGQVANVLDMLGRYYSVSGKVIHGAKQGRLIGFPTANIDPKDFLIPKNGVYTTKTKVHGKWFDSMSSIGHNPTLNCQVKISVESHIFDFDEEIYGEEIEIRFIKRLRDEIKYDSVEALVSQIKQDQIKSKAILAQYNE